MDTWVFGYGSLIWRPDFDYLERIPARLAGWQRRFWQGSHDHRGVSHRPGRVVTLIPDDHGATDGMAYRLSEDVLETTFVELDHREKNGYERHRADLELADGRVTQGVVYVAPIDNHAFLGPAPLALIARQIIDCRGPSGTNVDYLLDLANALRDQQAEDEHVFALERQVKALTRRTRR